MKKTNEAKWQRSPGRRRGHSLHGVARKATLDRQASGCIKDVWIQPGDSQEKDFLRRGKHLDTSAGERWACSRLMLIDLGKQTSKNTGDAHRNLIRQGSKAGEIISCLKGLGLELGVCVLTLDVWLGWQSHLLPGKGNDRAHLRRLWNESHDIGKRGEEERRDRNNRRWWGRREGWERRREGHEGKNASPQAGGQLDSVPPSLTLFPPPCQFWDREGSLDTSSLTPSRKNSHLWEKLTLNHLWCWG